MSVDEREQYIRTLSEVQQVERPPIAEEALAPHVLRVHTVDHASRETHRFTYNRAVE
jgi:hypothetical protein